MKKNILLLLLVIVACAFAASASAAERTTRDLVFEDSDSSSEKTSGAAIQQTKDAAAGKAAAAKADTAKSTAADKKSIGVKTTILLTRDGKTSTVLPTHEFKSGDSVKLVFTPSIDGYVYWMSKGSSGNYTMLFPSAKAGMDNKVVRNKEYFVPAKGSFRFDDKAGTEELLCVLSEQKLPDLEKAAMENMKGAAGTAAVASVEKKNADKRATRDLVFEDDDKGDVNTKQQTAPKGEPFVAHYKLTHK